MSWNNNLIWAGVKRGQLHVGNPYLYVALVVCGFNVLKGACTQRCVCVYFLDNSCPCIYQSLRCVCTWNKGVMINRWCQWNLFDRSFHKCKRHTADETEESKAMWQCTVMISSLSDALFIFVSVKQSFSLSCCNSSTGIQVSVFALSGYCCFSVAFLNHAARVVVCFLIVFVQLGSIRMPFQAH